jgi:hypothetical protein
MWHCTFLVALKAALWVEDFCTGWLLRCEEVQARHAARSLKLHCEGANIKHKFVGFFFFFNRFVLSRKEEQLRAVNERLLCKKVEQEEKTAQLNSMQKEYATLKGLIGNQAELKRKIDDNLQYRETRNKEEQMREQIEHLEQQLVSKGELSVLEAGLKRVLSELQSLLSEVISFF